MKILVGIIANDAARFSLFSTCVTKLDTRDLDVSLEWLIGGDWCGARNTLVEMTLEGDFTHLWFMDDDHAFAPDLLSRLAAHDVPLVNPLCLARIAPFPLVTYASKGEGEKLYLPIDLSGAPPEGLVELEAAGCAGMLIRRDVLEAVSALPTPCFEYGDRSEDIVFCEKAKACGFTLYGDLAARLGHITTAVVYPDTDNGVWMTRLKIGGGLDLFVSPAADWEAAPEIPDPLQVATPEAAPEPVPEPVAVADRIEIWVDEAQRWWWRAIPAETDVILGHGSGVNEAQVIADAGRAFPGVGVQVIASAIEDSRFPRSSNHGLVHRDPADPTPHHFGPPTRLWNRGDA